MNSVLPESRQDKNRFTDSDTARYRSALYSIDEGFCVIEMIFDPAGAPVDWVFLETNPAFEQQTGLTGIQGKRMRALIPDHEQHWFDTYGNVALTGTPIRFESFSQGLSRWFSLYAFRIDHPDNRRIAVIFTDISGRKQAGQRADFLTALSKKLDSADTESEIVRIAVEAVGTHLHADRCYFVECLESENLIVASRNWLRGQSRNLEGRYSLHDFGGIEWWRSYSQGNFAVEDVETNPLTRHKLASYVAVGVRSYAVQPYRREGEWTVILGVTETSPRKWTTHELGLMEDAIVRVWPLVERARANHALRESEERFRLAITAADMGSWRVDVKSGLSTRDPGFNRMLGRPEVDSTQPLAECIALIDPEDKPAALASWEHALATQGLYQAEFRIAHPDGTRHWLGERGRVIVDAQGAPAFVTGVTLDITARKQAEEELRDSKARLDFTLGAARIGDWDLDLVTQKARRSLRHDQAFGYNEPLDEWSYENFLAHVHPDDRAEVARKFSEAVTNLTEWHFECRVIWPDATVHWIEAHGNIYRTVAGQPRNMLGIVNDITARKRSERAVQSSEERHREMLRRLPVACYTLDVQGRLTFFNDAAKVLWGREPELGKEIWCGSHAMQTLDGQPLALEQCPAAVSFKAQRPVRDVEAYVLRPDGEKRRVIPYPDPLYDAEGKFAGVINVIVDITEQRAAEVTLRESEAFLQSVVGASADCLKVLDLEGRLEWMSDNGQKLMEVCDISSIQGKYWPELWSDASSRKEVEASIHAARAGRNAHFRGFCLTAAGTPKWWDVIVSPIIGSDGKPMKILSVSRDVTAMREVEEALKNSRTALDQRSEALELRVTELRAAQTETAFANRSMADSAERFRLLSEVVALQVWTANTLGELDYVNQECLEYLGGDPERDILGNAWAQYVHAEDLPSALAAWQASLASGVRYEVEFRLKGTDGCCRWFLVRAEAMRDREGNIVRWFGTNTDIHELKSAQYAAERASRAKDEFLAALSHELRTPLTPVLLTAASLREDERLPGDVRELLCMMERNISLEARLIDDLLDLTKISHGKLQLRAQHCNAHSLIDLAIEIVREDARARDIAIARRFTTHDTSLHADPARLQQVMWNLLRNAVKFTPRGGTISIQTSEEKNTEGANWLRIEVIDSGIGIEPARINQIFQPFDQGGLTGDHRFGGLGLGLAIARAVVDLHGGRISARSAGSNRGATFIVELPLAAQEKTAGSDSASPLLVTPGIAGGSTPKSVTRASAAFFRLLVVEDHENTLKTLRRLLERDGHAVTTASTVAEALITAEKQTFDLVISDLGLPDGTGNGLMEKLRATHGLSGIALSGYGMEEDIARSREAGFIAHLVKPIQFAELRRVLTAFRSTRTT